jgi:hypothetical protein
MWRRLRLNLRHLPITPRESSGSFSNYKITGLPNYKGIPDNGAVVLWYIASAPRNITAGIMLASISLIPGRTTIPLRRGAATLNFEKENQRS